jgi:hypothetical protein
MDQIIISKSFRSAPEFFYGKEPIQAPKSPKKNQFSLVGEWGVLGPENWYHMTNRQSHFPQGYKLYKWEQKTQNITLTGTNASTVVLNSDDHALNISESLSRKKKKKKGKRSEISIFTDT